MHIISDTLVKSRQEKKDGCICIIEGDICRCY